MPKKNYTNLVRLLMERGLSFRDQMGDLDPDTIRDILGARPRPEYTQEDYFTLVGEREGNIIRCTAIGHESQGLRSKVEFTWRACWDRHVSHGDVVGWFHTHPPGAHGMSGMDENTFQSWLVALGGPRYAVIVCEGVVHCWELSLAGTDLDYHKVRCEITEQGDVLIYPGITLT